jgi:hypothetical protein
MVQMYYSTNVLKYRRTTAQAYYGTNALLCGNAHTALMQLRVDLDSAE